LTILLVRHASAGNRKRWEGDDRLRPLDKKGGRQAAGLVDALADYPLERLLSSPYVRCTQTLAPLGEARGLDVEVADELAEGAGRDDVMRLLDGQGGSLVALCTHGDVVEELLGREIPKGATQVLERVGDELVEATYLSPPG
jgi:phosphohistidine phosphatase SixA